MERKGGFLIAKIKQLGNRIFERELSKKKIDAFNGAQGRILYVLWQNDHIPIKKISEESGLAITSLTTMLERMEKTDLIHRIQDTADKRKTLICLSENALSLKAEYDDLSSKMTSIYYKGFSEDEISTFEAYLERVLLNLERAEK